MSKALPAVIFSLFVATLVAASPVITIVGYDASKWPELTLEASIDGMPDFETPIFEAKVGDNSYPAANFEVITNPGQKVNVLFLVDISVSVSYNFSEMQKQLTQIAGMFSDTDTFSMMTFADSIETVVPFTHNKAEAGLVMGKLKAKGPTTRLYDVLIEGEKLLSAKPEKGIMFLLSDGNDDGSENPPTKPSYPVVCISPAGAINFSYFKSLANETSGLFMPDFSPEKLKPFISEIKGSKGKHYRVTFVGLPETPSSSVVSVTLSALIAKNFYQAVVDVELPSSTSNIFLFVILFIVGIVAIIMIYLWITRYKVRKGKRVVKRSSKGEVHYIAWIGLHGSETENYRIRQKSVVMGTDKDADFFIDDPTVSFHHARLDESPDGYMITDMQSVTGTWVNNESIEKSVLLKDGDLIRIGNTTIQFTQSDFTYVSKKKVI